LATSPKNPNFFVDDPGKLYRQRGRATQAKGLETIDPKAKVEGPSKSPRESPPPSPKEDQPQHPEREIKLCTPDIVDLPIINLQDAGRPFKIKRRMEKMEIEKEAQHLKASKARSTCEDCEEHDHVQEDAVTKFKAMEKILKNLDGKVTKVRSSICEVFIVMKMLETQVGQLAERPMGNKEEYPRQLQGPKTAKATQAHSGEMEDHTKETMKITTEGPEFEMPSHHMKEVVASVKTKGQSQPVKTKNTTKPKKKPVPKMVRKWVPKIATPAKSVDPK
jgi:hypothetical protein